MSKDLTSLEGKLVFVTGAGVGIGKGVGLELARRGADVVLQYASSAEGAMEAVEEITGMGRRATAIQGDLSQVSECRRVVDEAAQFLGGLDALVCNAGVTMIVDFLDVTEEQFSRIYNINIRGQYFCAQQAVPHIVKHGEAFKQQHPDETWRGGSIVNMSSVQAFGGVPGHTVYAGTKGAIISFSQALMVDLLPHRIRVNVVAPGAIEVPRYWNIIPNYSREVGSRMSPWGRVGFPEDVGYTVAFLVSDAAEFINGQVIRVDGGSTARLNTGTSYESTEG